MIAPSFRLLTLISTLAFHNCSSQTQEIQNTDANESMLNTVPIAPIGYIHPDLELDDPSFELCNPGQVFIYSPHEGIGYKGEKPALVQIFKDKFKPTNNSHEDGYITIRFMVNCEGKSGLFRVSQMNDNYDLKKFSEKLTGQIITITKSLDGWKKGLHQGNAYDYYAYLTFKIENGNIIDYLP